VYINNQDMDKLRNYKDIKLLKNLFQNLKQFISDNSVITLKNLKQFLHKEIDDYKLQLKSSSVQSSNKELNSHFKMLQTLAKAFNKNLEKVLKEDLHIDLDKYNISALYNLISSLDISNSLISEEQKHAEIQSVNDKINNKEKELKSLNQHKKEIDKKVQAKLYKILQKIKHEVTNLAIIEKSSEELKHDFARKMSIGFTGQYLKELTYDNPEIKEHITKDILFQKSIIQTISARHKMIMHANLKDEFGSGVLETSQKHLLPWQKSFEALKLIMLDNADLKNLILEVISDIPPAWNEETYETEKEIFIQLHRMKAYNRLMDYDKTIKIFLDPSTQSFIGSDSQSTFLKLYLFRNYIDALQVKGNPSKTHQALLDQIKIIVTISQYDEEGVQELSEDLLERAIGHLLSFNKKLHINAEVLSIIKKPLHKLQLADNLLENGKSEEALKILQPIMDNYEQNSEDYTIGWNCYKLMTMYHRCKHDFVKAIEYSDKAQKLLKDNHIQITQDIGGVINYDYTLITMLKAWCLNNYGKQLFKDGNEAEAQLQFKTAINEAYNALKIYKQHNDHGPLIRSADLHLALACSFNYLNNRKLSDKYLNDAKKYLEKIDSPNESMKVCELWIAMSNIYDFREDKKMTLFCYAQAEQNDYWNTCAEFYKLPKAIPIHFVNSNYRLELKNCTMQEAYNSLTSEDNEVFDQTSGELLGDCNLS
jgi:hypothetical protein